MKTALLALTVLGLGVTGAASASDRLSDVDYLRANRCKGLAVGLGSMDTASLDALLKAEGRSRPPLIYDHGQEEMARAKREAVRAESKTRLSAELSGACTAYLSPAKDVVAR